MTNFYDEILFSYYCLLRNVNLGHSLPNIKLVMFTVYSKVLQINSWQGVTKTSSIDNLNSNSILLHSGLNQAWHFWLPTRCSCCLKMKPVENIFKVYSRTINAQNWFHFKATKKLSLNQNVRRDHVLCFSSIFGDF